MEMLSKLAGVGVALTRDRTSTRVRCAVGCIVTRRPTVRKYSVDLPNVRDFARRAAPRRAASPGRGGAAAARAAPMAAPRELRLLERSL